MRRVNVEDEVSDGMARAARKIADGLLSSRGRTVVTMEQVVEPSRSSS